jgi:hypothetical protein
MYQTPTIHDLLSTLILNCTFLNFFLAYKNKREEAIDETDKEEVYYEDPDILGGIEGEEYGIVFGAKDKNADG